MIAFPTMRGVLKGVSGGFDADYQAILTRATSLGYTLPDAPTQAAGNSLVVGLKAAGIWNKLDVLYMFATTGDSNFATLNWKNPTLYQSTLVNSPTFRSKYGFKGDGTAAHINTNYNPATNGVQYTQNNASRFFYITTPPTSQNLAILLDGNTTASVNAARNASTLVQRINSVTNLTTAHDLQGGGFKTINRTDANTLVTTTGGMFLQSQASTSQVITSLSQLIMRSGATYYDGEIALYGMGSELTGVYSTFSNLLDNYMKAMVSGFDSSYQAILNRAVALGYNLPSAYCQYVHNDMVLKLKALGTWSKIDILYQMDSDAPDLNFATLNWKDPTLFQLTLVNSPTWSVNNGIVFDGTTQYASTGWIPSTHGVNWTLGSATMAVRLENNAGSGYAIGNTVGGSTGLLQFNIANGTTIYVNSTTVISAAPGAASTHVFRSFVRPDTTNLNYRGISAAVAATVGNRTQTATALATLATTIARSGSQFCGGTFRTVFLGGALTDSELYGTQAILLGMYGAM